jgi:hypothetical protein
MSAFERASDKLQSISGSVFVVDESTLATGAIVFGFIAVMAFLIFAWTHQGKRLLEKERLAHEEQELRRREVLALERLSKAAGVEDA